MRNYNIFLPEQRFLEKETKLQKLRKKIRLQGLSFKEELEGQVINFRETIVYLSLVPWEFCNWACQYCHETRRVKENDELTIDEMKRIIAEAGNLGIKSLLLLGGEVLLQNTWNITRQIVQEACDNGLITLIYTNGSQVTDEMADFLANRRVSIALKVDSLNREKYDFLTQRPGSFDAMMQAIEIFRATSIGKVVYENDKEKLVRLLFTTVGNSLNVDEYVSIARFATNNGARWMMEALNHRGDAVSHPKLALDMKKHNDAMRLTTLLNPEQQHDYYIPCRLFSCVTIRKKGEIGVCPQDYNFVDNIRKLGSLKDACERIKARVTNAAWREEWTGLCPIKKSHYYSA
jgi:MoaA/NifB/PqqE/SkfB family radical SAM enzyme